MRYGCVLQCSGLDHCDVVVTREVTVRMKWRVCSGFDSRCIFVFVHVSSARLCCDVLCAKPRRPLCGHTRRHLVGGPIQCETTKQVYLPASDAVLSDRHRLCSSSRIAAYNRRAVYVSANDQDGDFRASPTHPRRGLRRSRRCKNSSVADVHPTHAERHI